jgi:AraC-like DNA-binding protein
MVCCPSLQLVPNILALAGRGVLARIAAPAVRKKVPEMARADPNNVTTYWWDQHVPGLSLMRADFTSHDYAPHAHDGFVVAVTELGGARIKSRGVIENAQASRLFVSNPDEPQSSCMGASRRWRYRSMYLGFPALQLIACGLGISTVPHFTRNMLPDSELVDDFARLHRALEAGSDRLREHEMLIHAFGRVFRRYGNGGGRIEPAPRDRTLVRRVVDVMQARLAESLQLEELAAAAGLTIFQLIGLFKRTTGTTPHAHLTRLRLHTACQYLARGDPIAEAANAAGFCDQSALTRHFKRCYGITPLQFARAAAGNSSQYARRDID